MFSLKTNNPHTRAYGHSRHPLLRDFRFARNAGNVTSPDAPRPNAHCAYLKPLDSLSERITREPWPWSAWPLTPTSWPNRPLSCYLSFLRTTPTSQATWPSTSRPHNSLITNTAGSRKNHCICTSFESFQETSRRRPRALLISAGPSQVPASLQLSFLPQLLLAVPCCRCSSTRDTSNQTCLSFCAFRRLLHLASPKVAGQSQKAYSTDCLPLPHKDRCSR